MPTASRTRRMRRAASNTRGEQQFITTLNDNDVLCGRGLGPSQFLGNRRFRELVATRKQEYIGTKSYKRKSEIGEEIFREITSRGGRFLCLMDTKKAWRNVVKEGSWKVVDAKTATDKCKQTLRENNPGKDPELTEAERYRAAEPQDASDNKEEAQETERPESKDDGTRFSAFYDDDLLRETAPSAGSPSELTDASALDDFSIDSWNETSTDLLVSSGLSSVPPVRVMENALDSRLLLFHSLDSGLEQPPPPSAVAAKAWPENGNESSQSLWLLSQTMYPTSLDGLEGMNVEPRPMKKGQVASMAITGTLRAKDIDRAKIQGEPDALDEVSETFLSMLGYGPHVQRFTEQDEERERATMTEEEKESALSDTFGRMCTIQSHRGKKARQDIDHNTASFLLQQMKLEIVKIPIHKKQALLEASPRCRPEEFADERLLVFLRSQGMNAKLAAERFVTYWQCRCELFGPDKYALPMTLSEALRDDLVALQAGVITLLPHPDLSGRRILLAVPRRHTRKGYNYESLLRVTWYLVEIITREPGYDGVGYVLVVDNKDATLFDYDMELDKKIVSFYENAWPVNAIPIHCCYPSSFLVRVVKPVIYYSMSKDIRSRCLFHEVPDNELHDTLLRYGITRDMLPTEMKGNVVHDLSAWVANQRASEMGSIP